MTRQELTSDQTAEQRDWHAMAPEDALQSLETDADTGLSPDRIGALQDRFGKNRLRPGARRTVFTRLVSQFNNLFIYLLLAAGVITAFLGEWVDSGVIFGVVVIIAVIGFVQEGRAERALESVRGMLSHDANVRRGGKRQHIAAEDLVPGDIVLLEAGDGIPADLRLLRTRNLQTQEAALTGESTAIEKNAEPVARDADLGDRFCMAYSGTLVTAGHGAGVVIAIGDATEIGRISGMLSDVEKLRTPLMQRLDAFTRLLSVVILGLAALAFAIGTLAWGRDWGEMFFAAVAIAVAAIPEGLPAVMTVTLAIGVERMARRNAIIRRLPAVETLGAVTIICSDKTGTLTRNEMTARTVRTSDDAIEAEGVGYDPEGDLTVNGDSIAVEDHAVAYEMIRAGLLCNDASVYRKDDGWKPEGDPTEAALISLARKAGFDPDAEHGDWPRIDAVPFSSERRFMATLNHDHAGNHVIYVKGAPERLLEMCSDVARNDDTGTLDVDEWLALGEEIAARGQRLLAVARKPVGKMTELTDDDVETGFTLLGLFGLIDPPRDEAITSVAACHQAGIGVKMITGDHASTAAAVARELGLQDVDRALTGRDIEALDDDALRDKVMQVNVFARASPEHKLRLVKALQRLGQVTAMTGDGVNDAPALKRADVGISMGQKGTEAAREASEMVLVDDNFASIAQAVEEGRKVYDNLRKAILFILPTNAAEALIVFTAILLNLTLPITPVQILWVNMLTAVTLGIAFAWEKAEGDLMHRPPHPTDEPLMTGFVLWRVAFVATLLTLGSGFLFVTEQARGENSVEYARTMAVNALVMGQIFYLLNTRYFSRTALSWEGLTGNRVVLIAIAVCAALQLVFNYAPFMHRLFGTAPVDLSAWGRSIAVGLSVFVLVEIEKALRRRRQGSHRQSSPGTDDPARLAGHRDAPGTTAKRDRKARADRRT